MNIVRLAQNAKQSRRDFSVKRLPEKAIKFSVAVIVVTHHEAAQHYKAENDNGKQ